MTPQQKELARHALGLAGNKSQSFRNHFVTGKGSPDHQPWLDLVATGHAKRRAGSQLTGGDDVFWLTLEGATAALNPGDRLDHEDFPGVADA